MYDVIVIGAGVAGMSASIYLKRANLNVLLIEKEIPGGQINKTDRIENYPGFKKIDGFTLSTSIFEQVKDLNIEYKNEKVFEIKDGFEVITNKDTYKTKNVIIATGRVPRTLGLDHEEEYINKGISYCALCDGAFYKNKDVAVVGGADSAATTALYLSNLCNKVYLIFRKEDLTAQLYLKEEVNKKENIVKLNNSIVNKINGVDNIESINVNDKEIKIDGLFINVGSIPDTTNFKDLLELDNGYIVVDDKMRTSKKGIYACGDVIKKDVYQITTSISEGVIAANSIINDRGNI